jgi:hypothetical protein
MPINDTIVKDGTICLIKTVCTPGMCISHTCVDITFFPSSKLIMSDKVVMNLFTTSVPSMIKIDVAPMSTTAWLVAIIITFKYWGNGFPLKKWHAVAAINMRVWLR